MFGFGLWIWPCDVLSPRASRFFSYCSAPFGRLFDFFSSPQSVPGSPGIKLSTRPKIDMQNNLPICITFIAGCSSESRVTNTTITFTGESGLTDAIVQTWAATTEILFRGKQ